MHVFRICLLKPQEASSPSFKSSVSKAKERLEQCPGFLTKGTVSFTPPLKNSRKCAQLLRSNIYQNDLEISV